MRTTHQPPSDLRRRIDRLEGLPLRPSTARRLLADPRSAGEPSRLLDADPALGLARLLGPADPLALVADRPWWPRPSSTASPALDRLWRHAVAASCAARRIANETGQADPAFLARVALLHPLGYWAIAAVDPDRLADLLAPESPAARRAAELRWLGTDVATLGRDLAERWGCPPALIDAAWLHGELGKAMASCAEAPEFLPTTRRARAWADRTPWATATARPPGPPDPRVRLLVAEVQVRCASPFLAEDATPSEEGLARAHARRLLDAGRSALVQERTARRLEAATSALLSRDEADSGALDLAKLEALAEFAAGAGHELNNPLAVILGRAQLLLTKRPDPETARSLRAIAAQAQRAHRILRDLMGVARPAPARPRPCLPDEVVRACVRDLRDEADARGVGLLAETRDPGPRAFLDPEPLRHLADVLARNAIEATPPGGTVRFTATGDAKTLRWSVQDDGRGLAPDETTHLFDPFFCGRQAGRGLGLGLPRAARFVARSGGDLRWDPAPGKGTIFRLRLPLDPPPAPVP